MPKAPKPAAYPSTPTSASYISRGGFRAAGMGQRPNKLLNPIIGFPQSLVGQPSLLGGA